MMHAHPSKCLSTHQSSESVFLLPFLNSHIMNELIETERLYVEELQSIIEVHVSEIKETGNVAKMLQFGWHTL